MPGNPQIYPIALSSDEVKQLKAIASSQTAQVRHQQRAKILLLRSWCINANNIQDYQEMQ